ncbi:S-adenosyl-L-methionine-dependent methyltransferase [Lentinula aciculospora]|uniref:Leucine carboxyl methyltransferase 1 n=1 Tax=Lentinula aciculospora TaxID=153920 RepID=A0A9W9AII0_9AGAR|nr:S-adenosyl-L-methionine-dependent methyltransferase [Lentinula aciculospora]
MLPPPPHDTDAPIRLTDNDAALAKLSAVRQNYLSDPFIKYFVPRASFQPPRPPLINVGTFVRTVAIDDLVDQWMNLSSEEGKKCQIVSLGAGSDTRFWQLATGPQKDCLSKYIEIDFLEITMKKAMAIKKNKDLSAVLGAAADVRLEQGGSALSSPLYHLLPADLRRDPSVALSSLTNVTGDAPPLLDPSLPTLLIFECVLVYMSPRESNALLQWFHAYFSSQGDGVLGAIVYEMFGLGDSFGRVMVSNLKTRNVSLPGADPYPTFESLPSRFLNLHYTSARALTLKDIRQAYIDPNDLDRINKLELLDEVEELNLVLDHYAITWGLSIVGSGNRKTFWDDWGLKRKERAEEEE